MKRFNYFLLLLTLWPSLLIGQKIYSQKKIIGKVIAGDNGQALAFAHLSVGGNEVGTLSNEQGLFVLKIPSRLGEDTLRITYLGYRPKFIPVKEMGEDTLIIKLLNQDLTLDAIEIPSISPKDTLKKAWSLRGKNYEIKPTLLRGYYREEMEDFGSEIQFLFAEGVLELFKAPYLKNTSDRVRVLKGRQKKLPIGYVKEGENFLLPHITQGPHLGLLLDVMKADNSFIRKNNQRYYEYAFEKVQYHNNRLTYVFSFNPKNPKQMFGIYQGKIFIDLESLAIVRASYEYAEAGIRMYNRTAEKLELTSRSFEINYMEYQGKWYIQDARVYNQYYFPPVGRNLTSSHAFLTTEIINDQVNNFSKTKTLNLDDAFVESVEVLDEKFWEEYNVVPVEKN